jgi:DeoR family glycerol-3-phosphate regulon repressor
MRRLQEGLMDKLNPRQESILELARQAGRVSVDELASRLKVTTQTIRKDLNEMGSRRLLSRVHGGAVIASGVENLAYEARRFINQAEKQAIGRAAAALIPDTEEVARALQDHQGLLVITNNLNVATLLYPHPRIEVIIAGGPVRRADGAVIGKAAVDFIRQFKVDHAIVGVSAIDSDGALLDFDFREVQVARAIIENARQTILVADRMKFERSAPVRIGHLSDIDVLVTDRLPNAEIAGTCAAKGVRVIEVGGASDEGGG